MTHSTIRVAIIGAGGSGLAALKTLLETFRRADVDRQLHVVLYEKNAEVGGVWYDDGGIKRSSVEFESDSTARVTGDNDPSPLYDGLRTNLPSDLMAFRDHLFPKDTPAFPTADQVQQYIVSYADRFDLRRHIRFRSPVERLRKDNEEWVVEAKGDTARYDRVVVANGHYADTYIPTVPGLATFPGKITHSRFYRSPEPFLGQTVLVVGSFASGGDLARLIASANLNPETAHVRTNVYVSSEGATMYTSRDGEWAKFITDVPLIDRIEGGDIHLQDGKCINGVNTIIFATGYHYSLPFCHRTDAPWSDCPVLDGVDSQGGLRGLYMSHVDPLLLFLEADTSIAFPVLQYQIVPFPLAEAQARLIAYLWSGILPSLPPNLQAPPNPNDPAKKKPGTGEKQRKVIKTRKEFVYGAPYEWEYEECLMSLCLEADERRGTADKVPVYWKKIEEERRARREEKTLRKRTLGY